MPEPSPSVKSNADRDLERHVDPLDPHGARLSHCPHPRKAGAPKVKKPAARSKKVRKSKAKRAHQKKC